MRLRGLPFHVNEQEIADFFAPYSVLDGGIRIGCSTSGQRTGEAVALFHSAEEAERVCSEKHGDFLGTRWIGLQVITNAQYHGFGLVYLFWSFAGPNARGKPSVSPRCSPLRTRTGLLNSAAFPSRPTWTM